MPGFDVQLVSYKSNSLSLEGQEVPMLHNKKKWETVSFIKRNFLIRYLREYGKGVRECSMGTEESQKGYRGKKLQEKQKTVKFEKLHGIKSSRIGLCARRMSTCNQMLAAATKVAMIRRIKSRKSVPSSNKKSHTASSAAQHANSFLQPTTSERVAEAPRYMNSYRLEPKNAFNCDLVQDVLEEIVNKHCFGKKYDPENCVKKVKTIASEVLRRVKNFQFDRYRLIVYAQIGENQSQECEAVVRFLWDSSRDRFVTYNLSSGSMFTTVTCFGVYLD